MKKSQCISMFVCISFFAMLFSSGLIEAANEGRKEDYEKKQKNKLSGFEKDLEEIEAKSKETGVKAKADIQEGIKELKEKHKTAKGEMKKLDAAGKETWKDIKGDLDRAMDELEKTFDKVRSNFKSE